MRGKSRLLGRLTMLSARPFQTDIDAVYYKLELRLSPASSLLSGRVVMRARAAVDSLSMVVLDLSSSMQVDSVRLGSRLLPVTRYPQAFSVPMIAPLRRGEMVELEISYHGTPVVHRIWKLHLLLDIGNPLDMVVERAVRRPGLVALQRPSLPIRPTPSTSGSHARPISKSGRMGASWR